jgi:hypothetical protein
LDIRIHIHELLLISFLCLGSIDLKEHTLHVPDASLTTYQHCLLLQDNKGKKPFFIRADTPADFNDWYEIIGLLVCNTNGGCLVVAT